MNLHNAPTHARVLWVLRRSRTDVRCVLYQGSIPVEVQVFHDREVLLTELFPDESLALAWARAYGERLRHQGWFETPVTHTKAS